MNIREASYSVTIVLHLTGAPSQRILYSISTPRRMTTCPGIVMQKRSHGGVMRARL